VIGQLGRGDSDLLLRFADCRLQRGFAGLELAAGGVNFSGAEAALLADEQDAAVLDDEAEIGPLARLPAGPLGIWDCGMRVFDFGFWDFLR
jgi:hypothetical protein